NLSSRYNVKTFTDNLAAIADADVVILAVKPQQLQSVIRQIAPAWQQDKLLISIAAGIRLDDISRWLDFDGAAIVRAMPNTPSLVQAGATALCANNYVTSEQHELAESMLRAVGLALWISDEKQMDAVTALSGSGPAYFFLVLEALQTAGMELGLPEETARLLALETSFGAAKMALESDESACVLRQRVTSPGGTTERALDVFEQGDLRGLFKQALTAAAQRADELAEQLGQDYD
ncbi:MAG: pyrroline-5-carboxylate reductase, partial [Pseudomonadota bacterium]|nr:pyrroline-5-carboxylate reductase [Pseudomonadota bacterium]